MYGVAGRFEYVPSGSHALTRRSIHQRMELFLEVAQSADHPGVEKVYQGVRRRMPTVSLDTVYRTLGWLKELGLIKTLGPPRERTRFDANLCNHHDFVCVPAGLRGIFTAINSTS